MKYLLKSVETEDIKAEQEIKQTFTDVCLLSFSWLLHARFLSLFMRVDSLRHFFFQDWKLVPSVEHQLLRSGAYAQTFSTSHIPIPLIGPCTDTRMKLAG
jgi:hypothetical protein